MVKTLHFDKIYDIPKIKGVALLNPFASLDPSSTTINKLTTSTSASASASSFPSSSSSNSRKVVGNIHKSHHHSTNIAGASPISYGANVSAGAQQRQQDYEKILTQAEVFEVQSDFHHVISKNPPIVPTSTAKSSKRKRETGEC